MTTGLTIHVTITQNALVIRITQNAVLLTRSRDVAAGMSWVVGHVVTRCVRGVGRWTATPVRVLTWECTIKVIYVSFILKYYLLHIFKCSSIYSN